MLSQLPDTSSGGEFTEHTKNRKTYFAPAERGPPKGGHDGSGKLDDDGERKKVVVK